MGQTPAAPLASAAGTTGSGEGRPYQTSDAELERSIFVNYLPDVSFELNSLHDALQLTAAFLRQLLRCVASLQALDVQQASSCSLLSRRSLANAMLPSCLLHCLHRCTQASA